MRSSSWQRAPIAITLTALLVLILGIACVLEPTDGTGGGGPTTDNGTPQSTETVDPGVDAELEATVESVDTDAGLLMLTKADGTTMSVNVDQSTAITINGTTGTLADLQPGDSVEIEVDQVTQTATVITVAGEDEEPTGVAEQGTVEDVDANAGLLMVTLASGETITVTVDQTTTININGTTGTLADLQPGDSVEVQVDQETSLATVITVAGEGEEATGTTEQGTVEDVDSESGLLTLSLASGETLTVTVDQSTTVTINGTTGALTDLQPGDTVEVEVDQETQTATTVTVTGEGTGEGEEPSETTQQGTVDDVDAEAGLLMVTLSSGETITVNVDQSTAITINGTTGALADLQPGDSVEVEMDQETQTVTTVTVTGEGPGEGEEPSETTQQGTVDDVDADAGLLMVTLSTGETLTINVDQSTAITINGTTGALADLQPGDSVEVEMDQETGQAIAITVQAQEVNTSLGEITEVDLLSQTLTVETQDQEVLHLRFLVLDGSTEVYIDGGQGSLADLVQGASVEVTYNPETLVITSIHIHTGVDGGTGGDSA